MITDFKGQHACPINQTQMTPGFSGAKAASMRQVSIRFQISVQDWPPTQITLAVVRKTGGAYGYLNGALAMGKVYSLDSKQEHLDGSPLECDEITYEEHTDDVVSLLEENARLRKLVFRLSEIVLRNAVDGEWEPAAEL